MGASYAADCCYEALLSLWTVPGRRQTLILCCLLFTFLFIFAYNFKNKTDNFILFIIFHFILTLKNINMHIYCIDFNFSLFYNDTFNTVVFM